MRRLPLALLLLALALLACLWALHGENEESTPPEPPAPAPTASPELADAEATGPVLRTGAARSPVDVTQLLPEEAKPPSWRTGRVVDVHGRPVALARIGYWRPPPPGIYRGYRAQQNSRRPTLVTSSDGGFTLPDDFERGDHIGVSKRRFVRQEGPWPNKEGNTLIVLRRRARLSGRITDDRGAAVYGASVVFHDARPHAEQRAEWKEQNPSFGPPYFEPPVDGRLGSTSSDLTGDWLALLPPDRVRIVITLVGGATFERTVDLDSEHETHWLLTLTARSMIHVPVMPPAGGDGLSYDVHMHGATEAGALDVEDGFLLNEWSSPEERSVSLLLPGGRAAYWLLVFCDEVDVPCHVVGPLRGPQPHLRLTIPPEHHRSGRISGTLVPATTGGQLLVEAFDPHGFSVHDHPDRETGRFRLPPLPPGRYGLVVSGPKDKVVLRRDVLLAPGEELDLGTLRVP